MVEKRTRRDIQILVVDDDPGDVRLIAESLKDFHLSNEIHVAADGVEAMEFLRRTGARARAPRPDLVLLDLNMPRKGGLEVLEEIKQDKDLRTIPVVVLTTSSAERDIISSYQRHANGYVSKPVDLDEFLAAVRGIGEFWTSIVTLPPKVHAGA